MNDSSTKHHARAETIPAVRELRDSLILLGLAAASLGGYIGLAAVAVKLFASR